MAEFTAYEIIKKKRDGLELSSDEIRWFVSGYLSGEVPDYQASAWLMAIFLKGASDAETFYLTEALVGSGETLDLSLLERRFEALPVDKHSTGGVGDKVTLVALPIAVSCGAPMVKMSGRGLGHTGGTIDKLESIPGFRCEMHPEEMLEVALKAGGIIASQSPRLVPADAKFYALRDVTATVDSIPLIASSVMSKKIAAGARGIFLDVKVGEGAFARTEREALELARLMKAIGERAGRKVLTRLSRMDQPLGRSVGNALEVREAVETLAGRGPADLEALCLDVASNLIWMARKASSADDAYSQALAALKGGRALEKFLEIVSLQGGELDSSGSNLPSASHVETVVSERGGMLASVSARRIGEACVILGAGRRRRDDPVDPAAGVVLLKKAPSAVARGEPLANVYSSDPARLCQGIPLVSSAFEIK